MLDLIAYEHGADLRREAAAYRRSHGVSRAASRADRAAPRVGLRVAHVLRRHPAVAGCEA